MKLRKVASIALLMLSFAFAKNSAAQGECTINLNEAQKFYENGQIEKIPELLNGCLSSGFNRENKVTALRLLTLVYLFEDENAKAEESFVQMLKKNPEYKVNPNLDPIEFVRLYESYQTRPIFSVGLRGAFTFDFARRLQTYTYGNYADAEAEYTSGNGFSVGVPVTYNINNLWHATIEPSFSKYSFGFSEKLNGYNTIEGTTNLSYIDIPVLASYDFYTHGNTTFYAELGISAGIFLSGDMELSRKYGNRENADVTGAAIDVADIMKPLNLSCLAGVGAKVHVSHGFVTVGVRYDMGLMNVTNPDSRELNANPELAYKYRYVNNDIALSALSVNLGYSYEIYIHKKKK